MDLCFACFALLSNLDFSLPTCTTWISSVPTEITAFVVLVFFLYLLLLFLFLFRSGFSFLVLYCFCFVLAFRSLSCTLCRLLLSHWQPTHTASLLRTRIYIFYALVLYYLQHDPCSRFLFRWIHSLYRNGVVLSIKKACVLLCQLGQLGIWCANLCNCTCGFLKLLYAANFRS